MKILVLCLPGIGDGLMATPMIKVLKKEIPKSTIDVATMFDSVSYIFKNNKHVSSIYFLPLYQQNKIDGLKSLFFLRNKRYDVSILAFPAFRREYHIVQWLIGAKKRIAHKFSKGYFSECNFLDTNHISVDEGEHNVINNLNLLKVLGIDWKNKLNRKNIKYEFILSKEDSDFGRKYIQKLNWEKDCIIGLHPGSINSLAGVLKRWSIERFAQVARYLIKEKKQKILIFVGPFEFDLGVSLEKIISDKNNCQLVDNVKFNKSVGILSKIRLLISNDNGYAHVANALGIKTVVLFGPTNSRWCGPYDREISIFIRKAKFIPWFRNDMKVTNPPNNAQSGMESITVADLIHQANRFIL